MEQNIFLKNYIGIFEYIYIIREYIGALLFSDFRKISQIFLKFGSITKCTYTPRICLDRKLRTSAIDRCHCRSLTINKSSFLDHLKNTIFSGRHEIFHFFVIFPKQQFRPIYLEIFEYIGKISIYDVRTL